MTDETLDVSPALVENSVPEVTPKPEAAPTPQPDSGSIPDKLDPVQKRIDELTWRFNEERRQREALERKLEAAQRPKEQPAPAKPPTLEDHGFDQAKYDTALAQYQDLVIDQKADEKVAKALAERDQKQQQEARFKTFEQRSSDFAKTNPAYREKVLLAQSLPISAEAQVLIQDMELGPQVALHLVENQDEAIRIMGLSEAQQARELGRIEARLEAPKPAPVKAPPVSQAPPPPARIEATDAVVTKAWNDPELSQAEFNKRRRQQIALRK